MSKYMFLFLILINLYTLAIGHGVSKQLIPQDGLTVNSSLAIDFANSGAVDEDELWVVPGFLMGGEALPKSRGLHLSSASFSSSYRYGKVIVQADTSFHGHHNGVELETASIGYLFSEATLMEAGKLNGAFSPKNTSYRSSTTFVSPSLVYDIIWGRHYTDEGLRIAYETEDLHCGFEAWSGNRFPSQLGNKGKGAYDAYCRYGLVKPEYSILFSSYYYQGSSGKREDTRYSSEHSHGIDTDTVPFFYFSGNTEIIGGLIQGELRLNPLNLGFEAEILSSTSEGELRDTTRLSPLLAEYQGLSTSVFFGVNSHKLSLRYDHLRYKNELDGAAAADLAELAGLVGNEDPIAISVAYANQIDDSLSFKLEWLKRKYRSDDKESILCGLLWRSSKHI